MAELSRKRGLDSKFSAGGPAVKKVRRPVVIEEEKNLGLEELFIEFCTKFPDGCPQKLVDKELKHFPQHEITVVINKLSGMHLLDLFKDSNNGLVYKMNTREEAQKMANLQPADLAIYQFIRAAGNKGTWVKHLRKQSRMQAPQMTKILKTLEQRKLVKAVKKADALNRKVYMLYDLEPAKEITGGIWYDGKDFDNELFNVLYTNGRKWIAQKSHASAVEVAGFFRQSGLVNVTFTTEDIAGVLHCMQLDGEIEALPRQPDNADFLDEFTRAGPSITRVYRASNTGVRRTEMASVPCASCPVSKVCQEGTSICPSECEYLTKWLAF